ncbi:MAG TPA: hypothetical protein VIG34_07965 [Xanthobacteraceae bacterium]|jgi:hypothetical protein
MFDLAKIFARVVGAALPLSILALGVQPAAAQYAPPTISAPYEVAVALQRLGMRPIAPPRSRGLFWIVPAMDRDGTRVRVVIEAETGAIVDVDEFEPTLRPRAPLAASPYPPGPRYGLYERRPYDDPRARNYPGPGRSSDVEDDERPSGPRVIPADPTLRPRGQVPSAPRVAARPADPKPRTTPLPRPRPSDLTAAVPQPAPAAPAPAATPDAWGPPAQGLE